MSNATTTTNHNGGNRGGNNVDRAAQCQNLLAHWGDGTECACVYCGVVLHHTRNVDGKRVEGTLTRDRIVPGVKGGRYLMKNLAPSCNGCNVRKGDQDLIAFVGPDRAARIIAQAASYKRAPRGGRRV